MVKGTVRIGTSGWHYEHWKGPFYPDDIGPGYMLGHYAERFDTVEINNSFYRLPETDTFSLWADTAPDGFVFSVKASRYITHMKKLKNPGEAMTRLCENSSALGEKRGPFLYQLPPGWHANPERLRSFLDMAPPDARHTFEFRDVSWFTREVYDALAAHNCAFCIYELGDIDSPRKVTADFVYIRLHGPEGPYRGSYDEATLSGWAGALSSWSRTGADVYCYFDNDQEGFAPLNALRLKEMMEGA